MRAIMLLASLCAVLLSVALPLRAAEAPAPPTVEAQYLGLSSGPLRQAALIELPKGILLRAGAVTITEQQVTQEVARARESVKTQLAAHQFYLLEQLALMPLILVEARAWAAAQKRAPAERDEAILPAYLESIAAKAKVTEQDVRAWYAANQAMLQGAKYETIEKEARSYLLEERQQELVAMHLNTVSARHAIAVDAAWVKAQAALSLENPVDRARRTGKPALIDFGAGGCGPCEMMAPILEELKAAYAERCTVLFVDVREEPVLAARYGIQGIPVQIFFDMHGKEVFRHVGFFPKEKILEQLAAMGVN